MNDWTKTSKRMPEEWKAYQNLGAQTVHAENVTHWMYRPELPKEDE